MASAAITATEPLPPLFHPDLTHCSVCPASACGPVPLATASPLPVRSCAGLSTRTCTLALALASSLLPLSCRSRCRCGCSIAFPSLYTSPAPPQLDFSPTRAALQFGVTAHYSSTPSRHASSGPARFTPAFNYYPRWSASKVTSHLGWPLRTKPLSRDAAPLPLLSTSYLSVHSGQYCALGLFANCNSLRLQNSQQYRHNSALQIPRRPKDQEYLLQRHHTRHSIAHRGFTIIATSL
jgi:hypothetical protein